MDKRTRVLNAFQGKPVDRTPFSFWYHFGGEKARGEGCVQAEMEYFHRTQVDYMKIMSDGFGGSQADYGARKASDWVHIKKLGKDSPYFKGQVERCKRINEELKGEALTFYNIFAPFSVMRWPGDDMIMAHLKEDEESTLSGLAVIADECADLAEAVITEGGCTGVYVALQGAEKDRFSVEEYRRMITPSDLAVFNRANAVGGVNIAHLCGWAGLPNNLEVWKDYPAQAFNWAIFIENLSLNDGHKLFGLDKTVIGGFDNRKTGLLYKSGTKDEVKAFAQKTVRDYADEFGSNERLIIGADCTIPGDVDDTRFPWVKEALEELAHEA
ncbi:MAG: hypothetical protein LBK46_07085 [Oscillospiraceae bacterium]|jgi:uroporphyrinogen decarboxylase|nr:hypothetical protein [Oscillospiraceae bacterium]